MMTLMNANSLAAAAARCSQSSRRCINAILMARAVLFNHRVLVGGNICVPRLRFNAAFEPNLGGLGEAAGDM